ncbi:MAG: hypothetical protein AAB074_19800 [Planctomycetota bacterium]
MKVFYLIVLPLAIHASCVSVVVAMIAAPADRISIGDRAFIIVMALGFSACTAVMFGPDFSILKRDRRAAWRSLLAVVKALQSQNALRISDPAWTSGGHNLARWADRGYRRAIEIIETTPPGEGEAKSDWIARLRARLVEARGAFATDAEDVDGGATGAVGDAIEKLEETLL